jgi:hypothetical protein
VNCQSTQKQRCASLCIAHLRAPYSRRSVSRPVALAGMQHTQQRGGEGTAPARAGTTCACVNDGPPRNRYGWQARHGYHGCAALHMLSMPACCCERAGLRVLVAAGALSERCRRMHVCHRRRIAATPAAVLAAVLRVRACRMQRGAGAQRPPVRRRQRKRPAAAMRHWVPSDGGRVRFWPPLAASGTRPGSASAVPTREGHLRARSRAVEGAAAMRQQQLAALCPSLSSARSPRSRCTL